MPSLSVEGHYTDHPNCVFSDGFTSVVIFSTSTFIRFHHSKICSSISLIGQTTSFPIISTNPVSVLTIELPFAVIIEGGCFQSTSTKALEIEVCKWNIRVLLPLNSQLFNCVAMLTAAVIAAQGPRILKRASVQVKPLQLEDFLSIKPADQNRSKV